MRMGSSDINNVIDILSREFKLHRTPVVDLIDIQTGDPFKVLVTTILSARTKDETTSAAASRLFKRVENLHQLSMISEDDLRELIYPVGFYHVKAKHLKMLPSAINEKFAGEIPQNVDDLTALPGVGRKTANLVVAVAFKKPAVCVDVHVHRIFNRLGYVNTKNPLETEMALRKSLPVEHWTTFNSYFVSFGQHRCFPRNPKCVDCPIKKYCAYIKNTHAPKK